MPDRRGSGNDVTTRNSSKSQKMECDILDVPQERLPGAERPSQGGARAGHVRLESGIAHNLSTSAWHKHHIYFVSVLVVLFQLS